MRCRNQPRSESFRTSCDTSAFCAVAHARTSGVARCSNHLYGSATRVPWYTSTTLSVRAFGYTSDCVGPRAFLIETHDPMSGNARATTPMRISIVYPVEKWLGLHTRAIRDWN